MTVGRDAVPAGEIRTLVPGRSPEPRTGEGPYRPATDNANADRYRVARRLTRHMRRCARARRYRTRPSNRAVRRNPDTRLLGAPLPSFSRGTEKERKTGDSPRPSKQLGPAKLCGFTHALFTVVPAKAGTHNHRTILMNKRRRKFTAYGSPPSRGTTS